MADRRAAGAVVLTAPNDAEIDAMLDRFPEVAQMANAVYTPRGVRLFLTTPMRRFDDRTAFELLREGHVQRVISALAADYEGFS